jgi:GntR family transcriptional regulator / MocR family aminotransferase
VAEFISSGGYDRQVRRARLEYRRRRDRLAAALHRQGLHVTGIAAGLHAVLELPGTDTERQLVARAARHGLALQGLESFRTAGPATAGPATAGPATAGPGQAGLVIGYGRPPEHAYTTALARLCAVLGPELIEPPMSLGPRPVRG